MMLGDAATSFNYVMEARDLSVSLETITAESTIQAALDRLGELVLLNKSNGDPSNQQSIEQFMIKGTAWALYNRNKLLATSGTIPDAQTYANNAATDASAAQATANAAVVTVSALVAQAAPASEIQAAMNTAAVAQVQATAANAVAGAASSGVVQMQATAGAAAEVAAEVAAELAAKAAKNPWLAMLAAGAVVLSILR